jgi:hypothetical protein
MIRGIAVLAIEAVAAGRLAVGCGSAAATQPGASSTSVPAGQPGADPPERRPLIAMNLNRAAVGAMNRSQARSSATLPVGGGRISAATRRDYAAAAATALLEDEAGEPDLRAPRPAFDLPELARTITGLTGAPVTCRDLPAGEYAGTLQRGGLDEATAHFVAGLDASIARGDLETDSQDPAHLLGHPATPLAEVVSAAHNAASPGPRQSGGG